MREAEGPSREGSAWAGLGGFHSHLSRAGEREERGSLAEGLASSKVWECTRSWALWATAKGRLWLEHRVPGKELAGDENEKLELRPNSAFSAKRMRG